MSDTKPRTADWAPGTLEHTRQNIGSLSQEEAQRMTQVLGGEIMYEKSSATEHNTAPKKSRGVISRAADKPNDGAQPKDKNSAANSGKADSTAQKDTPRQQKNVLPTVTKQVAAAIDKILMSDEYKIKQNYGFFNFIRNFQKNGTEKISQAFIAQVLPMQIKTIEAFVASIKFLIQIAPNTYKAKITNEQEPKFRFMRMVAKWEIAPITVAYDILKKQDTNVFTADMIPYVKAVYRPIMLVYYYGDTEIQKFIKEIYTEMIAYPQVDKNKVVDIAKPALAQWVYICEEIVNKLYPLLMRMSTTVCEPCHEFLMNHIPDIMKFLGLHKFELLLKGQHTEPAQQTQQPKQEEGQQTEEAPEEEKAEEPKGKDDELVKRGLAILNQFFPKAGFNNLEDMPDMYPYFQPLYNFEEGFNILSPKNPLQITVVLLRILEDFFRGCRNIAFSKDSETGSSVEKIVNEWNIYREEVFDRSCRRPLVSMVNEIYSKPDFLETQFGKKSLNEIMWQMKNNFLPNYKFQKLTLETPLRDNKYKPLFLQTSETKEELENLVKQCDQVAKNRGDVLSIGNPWAHYRFHIQNEISKRLDVVLGGNNMTSKTNATNANLLKYTLCIMAVLDWWLNDEESPAYTGDIKIYRVSPTDGKPAFSTDVRSDQNRLFAEGIKAAIAQKKSAENKNP